MAWDAIVVGLGGIGSAALHALARRGLRVLGLEARGIAHALGSSHGRTRLWRRGYYEHADYVPLVDAALDGWRALEAETATRLVEPIELVEIGPPQGELIPGVRRSAQDHGVDIEELGADELSRRYAGALRLPPGLVALGERGAHLLWVERAIEVAVAAAQRRGAEVRSAAEVHAFRRAGTGFLVETNTGVEHAGALVLAAGPWTKTLLHELGQRLVVRRKPVFWYRTQRTPIDLPALFVEEEDGRSYYAFPLPGTAEFKAAEHSGGDFVADPSSVVRTEEPHDQVELRAFLARYLPAVPLNVSGFHVCMYTMSPDGHFFVDRHPEHRQLSFAAGLSGHGFKFAPVLGELLAALALGEAVPSRPKLWELR